MNSKQLIAALAVALTAGASLNAVASDTGRTHADVLKGYIKAEPNVVRAGSVTEIDQPGRTYAQVLGDYLIARPTTASNSDAVAAPTFAGRTRGEVLADLDRSLPIAVLERRSGV